VAAITLAATAITLSAGCVTVTGTSGEAISAGMPVYLKASDGKYWKADANLSAAAATVVGLNVSTVSAADVAVTIVLSGIVNLGATLTVGGIYCNGAGVAGDVCLVVDQTTGWYVGIIGVASTAALLNLLIHNSGVVHA
jgi:hypothetical protein